MKEIVDKPREPELYTSMEIGVFVGVSDEPLGSGGSGPVPPPTVYGGVFGLNGFGTFVFGAPENF